MKYKALTSFSGAISAPQNTIINIENEEIAKDLLNAGYIEAVEETKSKESKKDDKADKGE